MDSDIETAVEVVKDGTSFFHYVRLSSQQVPGEIVGVVLGIIFGRLTVVGLLNFVIMLGDEKNKREKREEEGEKKRNAGTNTRPTGDVESGQTNRKIELVALQPRNVGNGDPRDEEERLSRCSTLRGIGAVNVL
ncbi:uncharacterized protein PAC_05919 [Phialocephala subalpina]|uniref:Uncharacterized protein n=1 Tax=Phialocephala subalpina TaxID=576137 RepID=A0A1L7WTE6_9HELO|nr:uncharacterized protein PAC_05919 [Phialocephala subalpina]